tara:strand:- start:408 stop:614 length:207 start_codon:yes stop_codon:yes gene_type:complete
MTILNKTQYSAHVLFEGKYYDVSDNGYETLVFPSDSSGSRLSWIEVGGGRGLTITEVLSDFSRWVWDD